MSKSRCRFCVLTFDGLYLNCPKCGKWLPPFEGKDIEPENDDYTIIDNYTFNVISNPKNGNEGVS